MKAPPLSLVVILAFQLLSISAFSQGSLTPPGPPGPTMKSLDQIEARTPISALPFTISNSGSYYLTGNLTLSDTGAGITITANDVTLDLNGFRLSSSASSPGSGISIATSSRNTVVRNGTVSGWSYGLVAVSSADMTSANGLLVENVRFFNNVTGVFAGDQATVRNCVARSNSDTGFIVGAGSVVEGCSSVLSGKAGFGANHFTGSAVTDVAPSIFINCNARANGYGFEVTNAVVSYCSANGNNQIGFVLLNGAISHCFATDNTGAGFLIDETRLSSCTASGNNDDGITVLDGSFIVDSLSRGNKRSGIRIFDFGNTIDNNLVVANTNYGIEVVGNSNLIVRNKASGNKVNGGGTASNYQIAGSNRYGDVQDDTATGTPGVTGNGASGVLGTSSPWANISY